MNCEPYYRVLTIHLKWSTTPSRLLLPIVAGAMLLATLAVAQVDFSKLRAVAQERYGAETADLVAQWEAEIDLMRSLSDAQKLQRANHFFNSRIRWVTDTVAWQQNDYWATPLEVIGLGMGDCEDFAIAKYTTLVLAGVDVAKLRITYVKAKMPANAEGAARSQAHMILAYYDAPDAEPVVLDNIVPEILPASSRTDLTPVYGFNSLGIWVGGASTPASTQPETRLSRWRDVLRRAQEEGLE